MNAQQAMQLHYELSQFLYREADLLDNLRMREWQALFTRDVTYEMPVRTMQNRGEGVTQSDRMYHFLEDWESLELRIKRLETKHAWAEDPPSRTRRLVGNIRIVEASGDRAVVKSNLVLTRNRGFGGELEIISAERQDTLLRTAEGWKIARRTIVVDQATLGVKNLGIFL